MKAELHPEFSIENKKLVQVVDYLDRQIQGLTDKPALAADNVAARTVRQINLKRLGNYKEAQSEPYFGRVDWRPTENGDVETFYIGKHAIQDREVYEWRGTLAADIYYQGYSDKEQGTLLLKRTFGFDVGDLREIVDDSKHPLRDQLLGGLAVSDASLLEVALHSDEYLHQILDSAHSGQLGEVVATIQAKQYQIIKQPLQPSLILQGAPGTGKTIVALHRIAFLLYAARDDKSFDRSRVIFFAPNPIFSQYVARVLPELNERGIIQTTFDEWATAVTGLADRIEPDEETIEALLSDELSAAQKAMRVRNARNKGSLQMAQLLQAFCTSLRAEMLETVQGIELTERQLPRILGARTANWALTIAPAEIELLIRSIPNWASIPVNQLKERASEFLQRHLLSRPELMRLTDTNSTREERRALQDMVDRNVARALGDWKEINLGISYRRLLRSSTLLTELGGELFSASDLLMMNLDAPRQGHPLRSSDLAALIYLHGLLNGIDQRRQFDLVVIDEAQDLSPLQFAVLKEWSRNNAFTIVGDVAQSINPYRGLGSWQELAPILGEIDYEELTESYRSTGEIIDYTRSLRQRMGIPSGDAAQPFRREGEGVVEYACADNAERISLIGERLLELVEEGGSVCILAKTSETCRALATGLRTLDLDTLGDYAPVLAIERNQNIAWPCVVMPAYLAKGLEFDHVLIADADTITYTENALDAGLLYVAATRGTNSLDVFYIGERSPLLKPLDAPTALPTLKRIGENSREVLVAEFALGAYGRLTADEYIARLAASGNLGLLVNGRIDEDLLAILAQDWGSASGDDENVPSLSADARAEVASQIRTIELSAQYPSGLFPLPDEGLAMLQLAYGLLRNALTANLGVQDANLVEANEQANDLLQLWLVGRSGTPLARGALTTRNRVLGAVAEVRRELAQEYLAVLHENGIVETIGQGRTERLGVAFAWIVPLLEHALGNREAITALEPAIALPALPINLAISVHLEALNTSGRTDG